MSFDLNQLNDLDLESVGSWPREVKIVFAVITAILVAVAGYFFAVKDSLATLDRMQSKETELRQSFEQKYRLAANLPRYREQLSQMKVQFNDMVDMLPTESEMPGLIDDVTFLATDADLKISRLEWQPEQSKEFYTELPIEMSIAGGYHEFGEFSAGVAKLPRIVSFHDFVMSKTEDGITVSLLAKTYRFSEQEETDGKGKKKGGKR